MLLRDVVWLGIASKLSLLSPYTTLLRDVVWLGIASKLSLLSPYTTFLRDVVLSRHSEQALSALTLYNAEVFFIPFWVHLVSNLRSGARAKAERTQSEGTLERRTRERPSLDHFQMQR